MEVQLLLRIDPLKFSGGATAAGILDQMGGNIHYDGKITPKKSDYMSAEQLDWNTFNFM